MGKGKKQADSLGKSLIRSKNLNKKSHKGSSNLHTTDLPDGYDWARLNVNSVTEETSLEEFLVTAELAGAEFTAERLNAKIVDRYAPPTLLTKEENLAISNAQESTRHLLRIPRRPQWDSTTSKDELLELEKESFLNWRRQLAQLQQVEHIILTPYEKNLEFWRQLWRVIERSDIVVQIVDARNPLLFWFSDLEEYVKEIDPNKIPVILLNKSDFLTPSQRKEWANYFNKQGQLAVFFSALQQNNEMMDEEQTDNTESSNIESLTKLKIDEEQDNGTKEEFTTTFNLSTRTELLNFFKRLSQRQKTKEEGMTTVGLVGYPNVGKSSTINALLQGKKVSVSATPGKTKHFQTILIDSDLCLCDCPGLVFPNFVSTKAEMIINGILPIDNMTDPIPPTALITSMVPRHVLQSTYKIFLPAPREGEDCDRPPTAEEFLNSYGCMRGFLTQRGLPDIARSARHVLKDFVNGKLVYCHAPPGVLQSDYHIFPSVTELGASSYQMTPMQAGILKGEALTSNDVDKAFFAKETSKAHYKHLAFQSASKTSSELSINKPWKKHNNRNKKEKLRRVYNELDR